MDMSTGSATTAPAMMMVAHATQRMLTPTPTPTVTQPATPIELSWETVVVATELLVTLVTALWLVRRQAVRSKSRSHNSKHKLTDNRHHHGASLLVQPQPWCSLGALLGFRLAALAFYVVVQTYDMYHTRLHCLAFYTSWNFIVQGVYFAVAAARTQQARRCAQRNSPDDTNDSSSTGDAYTALLDAHNDDDVGDDGDSDRLERAASAVTPAQRTQHRGETRTSYLTLELVFDVCLAASLLVCFVVWVVLYPLAVKAHATAKVLNIVSYCQHAANVVVLQLDFACSRHAVSSRALPLLVVWSSVYTLFAWAVHAVVPSSPWLYPFLDLSTPWAPAWYTGGLVAAVVAFGCALGLSKCKRRGAS